MAKLKNVEKRIFEIEGFEVVVKNTEGKDVHGNKEGFNQWDGRKQTKNSMTVNGFKDKIEKKYQGYKVDVLDADGNVQSGNKLLGNVRDTYLEED